MENCCCGLSKTTTRDPEEKKKLLNRLKRIEGQVRGLQAMLQRDAYCYHIPYTKNRYIHMLSPFE